MRTASIDPKPGDQLLTVEEAAAYLRVTEGSIYQRVARGQIPYLKMGRLLRFWRSSLEAYIRDCQ
jgi:excisionase family DNA binding protein